MKMHGATQHSAQAAISLQRNWWKWKISTVKHWGCEERTDIVQQHRRHPSDLPHNVNHNCHRGSCSDGPHTIIMTDVAKTMLRQKLMNAKQTQQIGITDFLVALLV